MTAGVNRVFVYEHLSATCSETDPDDAANAVLLPAGLAMRDAMVADLLQAGCEVVVAGLPELPLDDGAIAAARQRGESGFDQVARLAGSCDLTWLVAPETDALLTRFQARVDPSRWLGCQAAASTLASSKRATRQRLAKAGLCTPLHFQHAPETRAWVVKPDDGAGAVDTQRHASFEDALSAQSRRIAMGAATTLEAWVEGEPLSVSLLCSAAHAEVLAINRQHIETDAAGCVHYRGVTVNAVDTSGPQGVAITFIASAVHAAIAGLRGFVGIDLVWHAERGPVVIEVNPRVTCAYVGLSQALGRNIAAELIAAHAPERRHAHG